MDTKKNERLRMLRKYLHMSQEKFGAILGLSKSGISEIEAGRRKVTEQHLIMLIQNPDLNVNPSWLRDGVGDMFLSSDNQTFEEYVKTHKLTDLETKIIQIYLELDPKERQRLLNHFADRLREDIDKERDIDAEIDAQVAEYRRQLEIEKKVKGKSEVS